MASYYNFNKINYFQSTYKHLCLLPKGKCRCNRSNTFIVFEYECTSTNGNKYKICINYEINWAPRVWIVEPDLTKGYIPHSFVGQHNRLCLYHSDNFKWSKDKDIVQTILCWSILWIEYYEIYQILGKWVGPEAKHGDIPKQLTPRDDMANTGIEDGKAFREEDMPKYLRNYPIRICNV